MSFKITEHDKSTASTFVYARITGANQAELEQGRLEYLKTYPAGGYMTSFMKPVIKNGEWLMLIQRLASCE